MHGRVMAAMLHQAFLLGSIYELDMFGQITRRLFENLNARFYQSSGKHKYVSHDLRRDLGRARVPVSIGGASASRRVLERGTTGSWR